MRSLRGRGHAFPFPGDGAATLSAEQAHSMNGTGFRLVYEIAFSAYRGTMHNRTPDVACGPERGLVTPLRTFRNLGFRLAREGER